MLQSRLPIERSATRHEFAERWREDEGFRRVINVQASFADVELEPAAYDRISVIDET